MDTLALVLQFIIALGIFNVWVLRFGKSTNWRGGDATNMKEEFAVYGLPEWFMKVIGGVKILLAIGLIAGIWYPQFTGPAAFGMAILMLGAVSMHIKVGDPFVKSLPAFSLLACSLFVGLV